MTNNNVIYRQKDNSWMVNVAFYACFALLVLVVFSYGVFSVKVYLENRRIGQLDEKIAVYGTAQQKQHEREVFDYKKKIDDFAQVLASHKMSSNVFSLVEQNALPGVWFSGFTLSAASNEVRLSGEAQDMATLARQFAAFEARKEYVNHISVLNSQVGALSRVSFAFNIALEANAFKYGAGFLTVAPVMP